MEDMKNDTHHAVVTIGSLGITIQVSGDPLVFEPSKDVQLVSDGKAGDLAAFPPQISLSPEAEQALREFFAKWAPWRQVIDADAVAVPTHPVRLRSGRRR